MKFASVRLVTKNIEPLVAFYRTLTGVEPERPNPAYAHFGFGTAALDISSEDLVRQFNAGAAQGGANRSAIIEFEVDDVDAVKTRLGDSVTYAMPPTDMPWGNRSMLLHDPEGNVINVFKRPNRSA